MLHVIEMIGNEVAYNLYRVLGIIFQIMFHESYNVFGAPSR